MLVLSTNKLLAFSLSLNSILINKHWKEYSCNYRNDNNKGSYQKLPTIKCVRWLGFIFLVCLIIKLPNILAFIKLLNQTMLYSLVQYVSIEQVFFRRYIFGQQQKKSRVKLWQWFYTFWESLKPYRHCTSNYYIWSASEAKICIISIYLFNSLK